MEEIVLVTYASKYGATGEIAERIGEVLRKAGVSSEVKPVDQVSELKPYGAVILGSAVYAGQWLKEAAAFLTNNEQALAQRPVWIFSSGPTGEGDPEELIKGWRFPEGLQPMAERIQPRDIAFFSGELDVQKLNLAEKLIVKAMKAPMGDYRDWEAIESWAEDIAERLKNEEVA
jgi:menaquinone-dependent protoporphyrinogen oxidase